MLSLIQQRLVFQKTPVTYFEGCEVIVKGRFLNQRVAPCPLEVRGAAAVWGDDGRLTQWLSTQHAQGTVAPIAAANGVAETQVHILTPMLVADLEPKLVPIQKNFFSV